MDPVSDPILPETFLAYSRESNRGPIGWQSDELTTIPKRRSCIGYSGPDNSSGKALGNGLDGPGSISASGGMEIFLHFFLSRLALGPLFLRKICAGLIQDMDGRG